jgi:hypothetical protein
LEGNGIKKAALAINQEPPTQSQRREVSMSATRANVINQDAKGIDQKVVKALSKIEARRNQVLGHIHMDLRRVAIQRAEVRQLDRQYDATLAAAKAAIVRPV